MTIDERLAMLVAVQASHDDQIGRLVEEGARLDRRMDGLTAKMENLTSKVDVLAERTIQAMDAINRLANIAGSHEDRISDLEDKQ